MIEEIKIENFKSITQASLKLKPLNILIGRNGSGKSNFISFFHLLREGANGNLNSAINAMGGFTQVLNYRAGQKSQPLGWEIVFSNVPGQETLSYLGEIIMRGTSSYVVRLEELTRPPYRGYTQPYKFLSVAEGRVRILKSSSEEGEPSYDESDQELVIAQVRNRIRYPVLGEMRGQIADWQILRGFGSDALKNIRAAQIFNVVEPLRLDPSGVNLVSVLHQLANQPQYESIAGRLNQALQVVFPDFVKFDIPIIAGGMGSLNYRSHDFNVPIPALAMSDGQLRFLGLLITLLLPEPPSLIAIDEPEVGLHPEMMEILATLLQEASQRTQIIIATHSPQFIDFVRPDDVILVEREAGATRLERANPERLHLWLERYTLGKLWTMGKLALP